MHISRLHARALHAIAALCVIAITLGILPMEAWKVILVPIAKATEVTMDNSLYSISVQANGSPAIVFTSALVGYSFYIDHPTNDDLVYRKTTDGGLTWGNPVIIDTSKAWWNVAVWYDQWTPGNTTGTLIHILAVEHGTADAWYTYVDTATDTVRSSLVSAIQQTNSSYGQNGQPSITKNTEGNLFAYCNFTATAGGSIVKSTDGGANWSSTPVTGTAWSTSQYDQIQLLPLKTGSDIIAIKSQASDNTMNSRVYSEASDGWATSWSSIATAVQSWTYGQWFNAMVRKSTGDIYLTFANNTASVGNVNDIEFWSLSDSTRTWTHKTDVITNDGGTMSPIVTIDDDLGEVYVAYLKGLVSTNMDVFYKRSKDGGTTWSNQSIRMSTTADDIRSLRSNGASSQIMYAQWYSGTRNSLLGSSLPFALVPSSDVTIDSLIQLAAYQNSQTANTVFINANTGYAFYVDATTTLAYRKTTDGGQSWGSAVTLDNSKSWHSLSIWYDGWTPGNRTGTGVSIIGVEETSDDTWFISLDVTDDVRSTLTKVHEGTTYFKASDGPPSIVRGSGGTLYASGMMATPGVQVAKSIDNGKTWSSISSPPAPSWGTSTDKIMFMPLKTGQDVMAIRANVTSNLIQYQVYNKTADSWPGWSTVTSLIESTTYNSWMSAAVRTASGDVFLTVSSQPGNALNDIEFWHFKDSTRTWTQRTNLFTDTSTVLSPSAFVDEATGTIYVAYTRGTLQTNMDIYYKYTLDNGVTWSAEQGPLNTTTDDFKIVRTSMNSADRMFVSWFNDDTDSLIGTSIPFANPAMRQSAYRMFSNANSLDVGTALAAQNTATTLSSVGQSFRVRMIVPSNRNLAKSAEDLALQYAKKGGGTCVSPTGTYANVSDVSTIRWNDNASAKNGAAFTSNASDPTYSGTTRNQSYVEGGAFTNSGAAIASGENGMWDFSLKDNGGYGNTYCLRITKRDGTTLTGYDVYPEITTAGYQVISGSVYTDEGTTGMGAGRRVSISLNGGAATGSGLTRAGGFYRATLTGATLTGGTIISAYLDGATEKAVTVTLGSGSSMTGVHLYQNHLIVRSDSGATALTSAHLNIANNNSDSDITALYNTDASNNLQVVADKELYVWNGDTFAPGAKVRTHDLEVKGTLALSTYGLTLSGSLVANAGTLTTSTGITLLNATGETFNPGTNALKNLTLQSASSTLGSALDVNGTLTIGAGSSLDVSASNYGVTLSGSLINKAGTTGFVKRSGTMTLDGGDQTLSGSTIFHNLSKTVTTAKTLTFYKGYTTTVSGALTLQGTTNNLLSLRSSTNGTAVRLVLDGDSGTQSVSEVNVQDNNATGGATILCTGCTNGGNNTNWAFPFTVTVYDTDGSTRLGANKTVAVAVNGGTKTTAETNASSDATFTTVSVSAGDILTMWLDDETENGVTVTIGNGTTSLFSIRRNHVTLRDDNGTTITNTILTTAMGTSDDDLTAALGVSAGSLTVQNGFTLLVNGGDTFAPGGTVSVDDLSIAGTMTMGSSSLTVRGSMDNDGTFTTTGTATFTATSSETISMGGASFQHLVLSGVGGSWTMQDALSVGGNLTISAGTLTLGSQSLTVGGTFSNDGTLSLDGGNTLTGLTNDTNSGEIRLTGAGSYASLAGMTTFYDLSIAGTGTWALSNNTTVNGNFTQSSGTVKDGGKILTVGGNVSLSSTFTATGTLLLTGASKSISLGGNALKNLTLQSASSTLGSALDVNGTLTIGAGSSLDVSASNYGVTLSGSLINKAGTTGFVKRSGTVTLDGGDQTLSGSTIFHNLSKTVTTAKTLTLYKGYTTTVSGALTLQGTTNNLLSLRSSTNGTATRLVLDGDSGTQSVSYVNAKDNNATGGATILCSNCNNTGNNTNWAFPITVTVYDTDGNVGLGANKTVAVAVNGGAKTTAETNASSDATFTTVSVSADDVLTMWLDDETENGVTIAVSDGNNFSFSLRRNHVTLRDDNGTTITNTILTNAMGTSDDDLTAALGVSAGSLTVQNGFTLLVNGGDTFAPGGTVSVDDLSIAGTMTMGSSSLTVRGSMDNDGTFTTTGTATFTGASSETISMGGASFQHLVLNGAGGTWTMQDALSVGGNLTITAGTLTLGSQSLTVGGTFSNDGTLSLDGGNTLTGLTNDTNSGEIRLTGAGSYASLAGMTTFYDLSIAGTGTWALSNNTTVNGNFTQSSGTVKDGGKTLTVGGNVSLGSTFTATGTLLLTGTSKSLSLGGNALKNLTLQSASSTLGSALDVNGTLTIGAGSSLDVSASNYGVTLSGSLINKAGTTGFVKRSGTVTLDGGDQTLSGSTIFHNLSKTVTTAKTLTLYKGYTTTVSGALTLQGTTNNLLSLRSSTNGTAARLVLDGDSGTQSVSEVNVQDNNATGGATILCTGCTNGGNNTNWAFPIGGIAYSDEGVTPISAGTTIAVSVNGGSATTTTTAANGTFSMLGPAIGGGDVVAFYIDNAATKGATIILGTGGIMPSVAVYGSRLIIDHSTGGTVTTAHLATADNGGDTDLTALYTVTGNDLTVHSPYELFVWHGTTFRPGGLLATDDIDVRGTLTLQTYATSIGGSLSNSGGTISASNTVTFDSSSAETIRMNSSAFQHLVLSGVGGSWTMQDALSVGGNLTITAGTLTLGSQSLTIGGTFANDGTLSLDGGNTLTGLTNDTNSGEIRLTGAGSYASLAGMTTFYDLSIAGTGTWALSNNTTVNGNFTQSSGTVKDGGKTLTVGGNVSLGSTFTATGTLLLTGTSKSISLGGNALKNLTLQSASSTLGSALDVNGTLTIGAGSSLDVSASNYGVTLSGSLINKAGTTGFVKRSGTVTLDGGDQTLSGSTIFHNLSKTVTTAKTLTLYKGYTTTVSGALTLQGTTNNLLSLRSSTNGTAARLVLDGDSGTQSVSEVNVQDNNATGGATILCTGCTNGGNNTNWAFPITVTVYDTNGSTGLGASKTVAVAVNGGAKTTAETNASSVATFLTVSVSAGDIVTVWLDDETEHAVTIAVSDGNNFSFPLVRNRLTLRSDNGSSLTNAHLITAASAGSSDSDIASIYGVSGGALMTGSGISLLVATSSTYTPGGAVHTHDLTVQGAMAMSGSTLTLSGSLTNAGTFTSTGTVTLTSRTSETIALGGSSLMHMTLHGTGGTWTMQDALTMSGNLTIAAGTLMLGSHALTIEGTFSNNGTLQLNGDNVITGLTNDTNSGEVKFTGSGSYADTANIVRFYDLTIHGSGSWTLSEGIDVEHDFTQTQGAFRDAGYNMAVGGDFTATVDFVGSGTVMLLGSGTVANAGRFGGLIIAATDYTRRMETDLHLSEGLTINSGTFDVSDNNYALTVGGDWNNNATFRAHSGTVVLNGSGQTIYGDTTFYHFTSTGSVTDTLTFDADGSQVFLGTLRLAGASSAPLSLRSTDTGDQWSIDPRSTRAISYVSVQDSLNANATTILCSDNCSNAGNNTNWSFPILVTAYGSGGTTGLGAGVTVALSVNGGAKMTAETSADSQAIFTGITTASGDILSIWLDDEEDNAVTVALTNGTSLSFSLVKDHLILRGDAGALTSANLATADDSSDDDLLSAYTMSGTNLTVDSAFTLQIPSGKTFTLGGTMDVTNITIDGTLAMGGNAVTARGEWNARSGTVTGSNAVTFTSDDPHTITPGSNAFYDLTFVIPDTGTLLWSSSGAITATYQQRIESDGEDADTIAPTISTATASTILDTSAIIRWTTDESAYGTVVYGTSTGALNASVSSANLNLNHALTLTGLTTETLYYFRAVARDASGNTATGALLSFTTRDTLVTESNAESSASTARSAGYDQGYAEGAASRTTTTVTSGGGGGGGGGGRSSTNACLAERSGAAFAMDAVTIDVEGARAIMRWKTNGRAISIVQYGEASIDELSAVSLGLSLSHEVTLHHLRPQTWYVVRATSVDSCGGTTYKDATFQSGDFIPDDLHASATATGGIVASYEAAVDSAMRINADMAGTLPAALLEEQLAKQSEQIRTLARTLPGPIQAGEPVVSVTADTATIRWSTDKPSNAVVLLVRNGETEERGTFTIEGTDHAVTLRDLEPDTLYRYRVRNTTDIGTETVSKEFTFRTAERVGEISSIETTVLSPSSARFAWVSSVETTTGITWMPYRQGTPQTDEARTVTISALSSTHEQILSDLEAGVFYDIELWGKTPNGAKISTMIRAFTTSPEDLPPMIYDIAAHPTISPGKESKIQLTITWMTNESATTAVAYREGVVKDAADSMKVVQSDRGFGKAHTEILTNLEPGTVYSFRVESTDYGGSVAVSNVFTILTPRQQKSVFQVITEEFEGAFGWLRNLRM